MQPILRICDFFSAGRRMLLIAELCLCLGCQQRLSAQDRYADSLKALSSSIHDTVERSRIYLELSRYYSNGDTALSRQYRSQAATLAKTMPDQKKQLQIYLTLAKHFIHASQPDEAALYVKLASAIAKRLPDPNDLVLIHYYQGSIHLLRGNNKGAVDEFIQAYGLASKLHLDELKAHVDASFGVVYQNQGQFDSALVYYKKSLSYFEQHEREGEYMMIGLQNIGNILLAKGNYGEGLSFMERALEIAERRKDRIAKMTILGNISNGYQRQGKPKLAESYALKLKQEAEKEQSPLQILYAQTLLSTVHFDLGQSNLSVAEAKEAMSIARQLKASSFVLALYDLLIQNYEHRKDYQQAYVFKTQQIQYKDSLAEAENKHYLEEIKQKYNLQQKNQELSLKNELLEQTETANRQKTIIIISLLLAVGIGIAGLFLYFQRRRIREELKRKEAELDTQNKNFEAFIRGQEQERKRIASDLHDGLAQQMVMLKMGISGLNGSDQTQQKKLADYTHHIESMIEETRRLSHNMMPGVLVDLGLLKALKSLISEINSLHPSLQISLLVQEPFRKPSSDTEIQLYRIIQELLNNIIKHAEASDCEISLASDEQRILVSLKDNGKGFDGQQEKKGIGLQNIRSRVSSLHGSITFNSAPQQGTQVSIELKHTPREEHGR